MTEQITYLPSRRTFFTPVCPALGLQEGVSAEVLGAELDPRKGSRAKKFGKKDIVLSVRITNPNMPEGKISRIVIESKRRTPQQILDAIGSCSGPKKGRITGVIFCPVAQPVKLKKTT